MRTKTTASHLSDVTDANVMFTNCTAARMTVKAQIKLGTTFAGSYNCPPLLGATYTKQREIPTAQICRVTREMVQLTSSYGRGNDRTMPSDRTTSCHQIPFPRGDTRGLYLWSITELGENALSGSHEWYTRTMVQSQCRTTTNTESWVIPTA